MASELRLGSFVSTKITDTLTVVGIIAQDGYGRDRRYTNYDFFTKCLLSLAHAHEIKPDINVYMPCNIGCNNAGGDWNIVSNLIYAYTPFVILCNYN